MTRHITVDLTRRGKRIDLAFFAGEGLNFAMTQRPSGAEVVVTMGESTLESPLVQASGTDTINLPDSALADLPEGAVCLYNVWLRQNGGQILVQHGALTLFASIAPTAVPRATSDPVITGGFEVGGTLAVDRGSWIDAQDFTYQWTRNGSDIPDAEDVTFVPGPDDEGQEVGARVTAASPAGQSEVSATGAAVVTWPAPLPVTGLSGITLAEGRAAAIDLSDRFTGAALAIELAPGSETLPDGLSLDVGGIVGGAPTLLGQRRTVTVRASNSGGSAEVTIDLSIVAALPVASRVAPRLIIDGDSIMVNRPGTRDIVEAAIGDIFVLPQGYMQAVGGQTAADILAGLQGTLDLVVPGETVVLMGPIGANQTVGSRDYSEIVDQIDQIFTQLRAAGAAIVAIPTLPDESSYDNDAEKDALARYVRDYPSIVAVDIGTRATDGPHAGRFDPAVAFDPYSMKDDQSHPNVAGAAFLGERVRAALRPLVEGSALPDTQEPENLLGPDWNFPGTVPADGVGTTGSRAAGWNAVRQVGTGNWTLSKDGAGNLRASITDAPDRSILLLSRPVSFDGAEGDIYDMLTEIEVDAASTGYQGASVSFRGSGGATVQSSFETPAFPLSLRSSGVPLSAPAASDTARIAVAVAAGGSATFTFTRAGVFLRGNVAGALGISGDPDTVARVGSAYDFAPAVTGGQAPHAFDLASGALPAGLTLDPATGAVGGTPGSETIASGIAIRVADAAGDTATLTPFTLQVIAAGAPLNSAPPVITGTAEVGQTLTASPGSWSDAPDSHAYQWRSSGFEIPGANAASYVAQPGDETQRLSVEVVATNASGASAPSLSDETPPIAPATAAAMTGWTTAINSPNPPQLTYADNDRTVSATAEISGIRHARGADPLSGRAYFEIRATAQVTSVGIAGDQVSYASGGANGTGRCHWTGALLFHSAGSTNMGGLFAAGDVMQIALDTATQEIWMRRNGSGSWNNSAAADPGAGTGGLDMSGMPAAIYAYASLANDATATASLDGTADRLAYAPPSGFAPIV